MLNLKKLLLIKIISCIVIAVFISGDAAYSMSLRFPMGNAVPRVHDVLRQITGKTTIFTNIREKSKNSVKFIEIHPTNKCNLSCSWCTYNQRHDQKVFPFEALDNIARFNPDEILIVGGGEPTVYEYNGKSLNDFVLRLRELLPNTRLMLATNGTYIPHGKWVNEIYSLGISIHGLTRESFLKNTKKNSFDMLWENIFKGYLIDSTIKRILLSAVYSRDNLEKIFSFVENKIWPEWEKTAEKLRQGGKEEKEFTFILLPMANDSSADAPYELSNLSEEEKEEWKKRIKLIEKENPGFWQFIQQHAHDFITKPLEEFSAVAYDKCWMVSNNVVAAADGHIYPCFMMAIKMPKEGALGMVWDEPEKILKGREALIKNSHERCKSGCRVANTLLGGKVLDELKKAL